MATPRIFVSSTCYDLYDLRNNLRNFIERFGYEPVMSEFGDIFYDYNLHVQDACIKEIEKCQMFILIIGNNYGSFYHKTKNSDKVPSSVTLQEFKKAMSTNIAKHIFINRLVKYDYDNYRRFLNKVYDEYFSKNNVEDDNIEEVKIRLTSKFDNEYHFAHESYKHIFKFLDAIYDLNMNNAILTYETSDSIQGQLVKQWAGFMYERLESHKNEYISKQQTELVDILNKIDKIDKIINNLVNEDKENGKIILDIKTIKENSIYTNIQQYQELFEKYTNEIINNLNSNYDDLSRGYFEEEINTEKVEEWLGLLGNILDKFKWSKTIVFSKVFEIFRHVEYADDNKIPFESLLGLYHLYENASEVDKKSFIESLTVKLKEIEGENKDHTLSVATTWDDDLPF